MFYGVKTKSAALRPTDACKLIANELIPSSSTPNQLRVVDRHLLSSNWRRLLDALLSTGGTTPSVWSFAVGFNLENVERSDDGNWLVPMGDYGYELAAPSN